MPSRVDRIKKRIKKAEEKGKDKKVGRLSDKLKRVKGEETRLEQRQRKTYGKAQEAFKKTQEAGKGTKGTRLLGRTVKQQERMKRRAKGETGIYPIIGGLGLGTGGTTYGGKVKTSGLRKRAKKNR
jgi:hypothetical protein